MDAVRSTAFRSGVRIVAPALFLLSVAWSPAAPAGAEPAPPPPAASRVVPPAVLPDGARVSERLFGLPGLENVGRVAPGILRGAQPRPEGYKTLKAMGIRTVISLRSRHGESRAVEAAGMRSIGLPMNALADVDAEAVREAVALMTDPANLPVFVHCAHGRDRTGVVVAVYRMDVDGWKRADAEEEMQAFGFNDIWTQLRDFVRRYPAKAKR